MTDALFPPGRGRRVIQSQAIAPESIAPESIAPEPIAPGAAPPAQNGEYFSISAWAAGAFWMRLTSPLPP